jgi:PAS domain S-box-containing protein
MVIGWNTAADRVYGRRALEALGRRVLALPPSPDSAGDATPDHTPDVFLGASPGEAIQSLETHHLRQDGTPMKIELIVSLVENVAGETVGVSMNARDVTKRAPATENGRHRKPLTTHPSPVQRTEETAGYMESVETLPVPVESQ